MATILLQAAGSALGGLIGGPLGAVAGRALGALGGFAVDSALLSGTRSVEGPRLSGARIQEADEGRGVARVYGTARLSGQVIWMTRFEEERRTERQGGKGRSATGSNVTSYSYFGNLAVGLCEGPIAGIRRVWADGEELDLTGLTLRLHRGGETQMPDPLIEAKQGRGNAPAYRGLAYVVFERMPLERWGNRVPQFAFEVTRPVGDLERAVRAVTIIPGASEHGLDPVPVREAVRRGQDRVLNRNVMFAPSDFEASLDELTSLCPGLERAALVVSWFGTDLRAGSCRIRPGVETAGRDETTAWRVGPVEREAAHLISRSGAGPAYGGTPSDAGVVRAIQALRASGLKVTYYPFLLMDVPAGNVLPDPYGGVRQASYPWRGRITLDIAPGRAGSPDASAAARAAVSQFVGTAQRAHFAIAGGEVRYDGPAEWSYRRMVLHQACLAKLAGGVDAFVIGSELRGLTRLRDEAGRFPFVDALVALASDVKAVLPHAKITYAADWSEYFGYHPQDGSNDVFFQLDPLWSHPAIDMVGIDNYLAISDWRDGDANGAGPDGARSPFDLAALRRGIEGGENFDWYYRSDADRANRARTPISDGQGKPWIFRSKDLRSWWENPHFERRNGVEQARPTAWVPRSKPFWFTELGCPAIDKGANQPNVFLDPKSAESLAPHFSSGARDDLIQRRVLEAHLGYWAEDDANPMSPVYGGRMVDRSAIHLWTWDARPFPAFPGRNDIWSDGANWHRGHWLTGRLGSAPVDGLIRTLLADHGFTAVDASGVDALVTGFVVAEPGTARAQIEDLLRLCGVVASEEGGRLRFRSMARAGSPVRIARLAESGEHGSAIDLRRSDASETAEEVVVGFFDPWRFYQPAAAEAITADARHPRQDRIDLPVVLEEGAARRLAGDVLHLSVAARETARFALAPTAVALEEGDVVELADRDGRWLVTRIEDEAVRQVEARLIPAPRPAAGAKSRFDAPAVAGPAVASRPHVLLLDLPLGENGNPEDAARVAIFADPPTPLAIAASAGGGPFEARRVTPARPAMGALLAPLPPGREGRMGQDGGTVVRLESGALFSITRGQLLAGGNLCAVRARSGEWEVLQFEGAEEVAGDTYRLTGLIRAQGGTEDAMAAGSPAGAPFVLLDDEVEPVGLKPAEIGVPLQWRIAPAGRPLDDPAVATMSATLGARAVRPLSPVHLRGLFDAGGAFRLRWIRRSRVGGDSWDGIDVPLGEEIERYRVVLDAAGTVAVVETDVPSLDLSAAEQIRRFGGRPDRLDVRVSQYSLRHGAGTERRAVFERPAAP